MARFEIMSNHSQGKWYLRLASLIVDCLYLINESDINNNV